MDSAGLCEGALEIFNSVLDCLNFSKGFSSQEEIKIEKEKEVKEEFFCTEIKGKEKDR